MSAAPQLPSPDEVAHYLETASVQPRTIHERMACAAAIAWLIERGLVSAWPACRPAKPAPEPIVQGNPTLRYINEQREKARPKRELILMSMDDVIEEDIEWLWPGRIALGCVSTIMGRMGNGKSTLRDWLASTVSGGHRWPDSSEPNEPGTVLILQAEESKSTVVKHRMNAFNYGRGRVFTIEGIKLGETAGGKARFSLVHDAELLAEKCAQIGDVKMILVDPIGAYLSGMKGNNDIEVRDCFEPLKELAEQQQLSIVTIGHPNKDKEKDLVDRLSGSAAFAQTVRAFWYLSEDPRDGTRKLLSLIKENTPGTTKTAIAVHYDDRRRVITWFPDPVHLDANKVDHLLQRAAREAKLRGKPEADKKGTDKAKDFMMKLLMTAPCSLSAAKEKAMLVGIAFSTLRRAIAQLESENAITRYEVGDEKRVWFRIADPAPSEPTNEVPSEPV